MPNDKQRLGPDPMPWHDRNPVRVVVPHEVYFSIDKIQKVQKGILGRLGCSACCSGWDIRFELERSFLVDEGLNISRFPG